MKQLLTPLFLIYCSLPVLALDFPDSVVVQHFTSAQTKAPMNTYMTAVYEDGTLLVGNESGLLTYNGSEWALHSIDGFSAIYSLYVDKSNKVYVGGTNEFGFFELDSTRNWIYTSIRKPFGPDMEIDQCWQIVEYKGSIYYDTYSGIFRWDGSKLHHIDTKSTWLIPYEDMLIAAVYEVGMGIIENDQVVLKNTSFKWKLPVRDTGYEIIKSNSGDPLLFTGNHGIYTINLETFQIKPNYSPGSKHLVNQDFYDALEWRDSLILCTSWRRGLMIIDKNGNILDSLNKEKYSVSLSSFYNLMLDSRNNLWVTSNAGILNIRWPVNDNQLNFIPRTKINTVQLSDQEIINRPSSNDQFATKNNSLSFYYSTPQFTHEEVSYSFILEGFEKEWSTWKGEYKKEYTNLPPGSYIFKVKSKTIGGIYSEEASFKFSIPSVWYRSPWFYLFSIIGLTGLVFAFIRVRTNRLKAQNRRLERLVDQRTAELLEQKEQLADANNELRIINHELDNFVYRSSHDLVAPLKSLKGLIQVAKMDQNIAPQIEYLDMMNRSVAKLEEFIKSIMDYSINAKRPLEKVETNFADIINEILEDVKYYNNVDKIRFDKHFNENQTLFTDAKRLKIILSNLIINSIKYHNYNQAQPFIAISFHQVGDNHIITIQDNGIGIDQEHQARIFEMFFRASDVGEGSGLGLYIVKDTLDNLKGNIQLKSKRGMGTTFIIEL